MDVRLPDGTVIQNVPDGTTKAQLAEKLQANGYDISKLAAPSTEPTMGERAQAAIGGVNRGIAGLVGLGVDTVESGLNLGLAGVGSVANAFKRPDLAPDLLRGSVGGSQWLANQANRVGIPTTNPRPDDPASRMLYTGGIIGGGSMVPGARLGPTMAAAAGGAVAGETLGPEWIGVGALTPASAQQGLAAGKQALAERLQPRMEAFKQAGANPSVGQATEFNFIQGFENLLSKFPGGQGIFRKFSENQQRQLGETARTGVSAEEAGRAIEKGIKGQGGFLSSTKQTWNQLDDALAAKVGGANVTPGNTMAALDSLTAPVAGAEKTTAALVNPKLADMKANLAADIQANNGQIPFQALRALRSKVGAMLDDSLVSGVPNGELKKVYGALSQDMKEAANQAGAGSEFARQNNFWSARMDRVENVLDRVIGKTPEETFAKFMPKDANQATTVRATMRSLPPEQRQVVSEAVVNRLGRATPGRQNEAGDVFSAETFLTNWNKLSPGAKQQLFSDAEMRSKMDSLASVSENLRIGAKVFANPSGTAGAAAPLGIGYLAARGAVNAVSGDVAGAAYHLGTAGALMGGASIGAKMLTSQKVVDWLAQYPKVAPEAAALHLARLGVIYNESRDEKLKAELTNFVQSISEK